MLLGPLVAACALAACGGSGGPPRLDRAALAVADSYTRLAFNEHDCRAADHYSFGSGSLCRGGLSAADSFPLKGGTSRGSAARLHARPSNNSFRLAGLHRLTQRPTAIPLLTS